MHFSRKFVLVLSFTGSIIVFMHLAFHSESKKRKLFSCDDYTPQSYYAQHGNFWVLYNYFKASRRFFCDESITYTTHAEWTFLDNLVPLLNRWQGPLSLAIYSPGEDFFSAFQRIQYLRECTGSNLVKELVTFHLFFDNSHVPNLTIPSYPESIPVNCSDFTDLVLFGESLNTYKKRNKLSYPVNLARNIAREMATTHYVLPSDIELYPSPGLIVNFLDMIRRNDTALKIAIPKVFVLSVFEVEKNVTKLPVEKFELVSMVQNQSAVPFHKFVCSGCHRIPKAKEWLEAPVRPGLHVFHVSKRHKPHHYWEPFYIGTKTDPKFDERLNWEGRRDKMLQAYLLCVMDYEFHILDNAFLVHKPGIKRPSGNSKYYKPMTKQNALIDRTIVPELAHLYGTKEGCFV